MKVPDNSHPKLLKEYLGKRISLETMVILDGIFDYSSKWDKKMSDDVMWPDIKKLIELLDDDDDVQRVYSNFGEKD